MLLGPHKSRLKSCVALFTHDVHVMGREAPGRGNTCSPVFGGPVESEQVEHSLGKCQRHTSMWRETTLLSPGATPPCVPVCDLPHHVTTASPPTMITCATSQSLPQGVEGRVCSHLRLPDRGTVARGGASRPSHIRPDTDRHD